VNFVFSPKDSNEWIDNNWTKQNCPASQNAVQMFARPSGLASLPAWNLERGDAKLTQPAGQLARLAGHG